MKKPYSQKGQALISLVIFMVASIIIISGAVAVIIINSKTTTALYLGDVSYDAAEAGAENAIVRLLRNPNYTGETLQIGQDTAVITVTESSNNYTITSRGSSGNFARTVQVTTSYNNNVLTVTSWKEQ